MNIFHQADVDNKTHTEWIDRVEHGQRIYRTIAEFFQQVLTGKHGERVPGFEFDSRTKTFRLAENGGR
jgi:hypothetical protein